ncbi:MAG: methylated-DNA--[protein]-cysteine S-methyltransferase [Deltaproteobacteria bacterium]|nr:methylated-DNA--[protein]-cysteine S-methyltransferase [Deltaproteobacteria bacterium]
MEGSYFYKIIKCPLGDLVLVVSDVGLRLVLFRPGDDRWKENYARLRYSEDHALLLRTEKQLNEYFCHKRTGFDIPIVFEGTEFQKKTWQCLLKIPYGRTICYSEQARMSGDGRKARSTGQANSKNPISIIVPCHRVIGKDGTLTGYAGGLDKKEFLLDHEKARLDSTSKSLKTRVS